MSTRVSRLRFTLSRGALPSILGEHLGYMSEELAMRRAGTSPILRPPAMPAARWRIENFSVAGFAAIASGLDPQR